MDSKPKARSPATKKAAKVPKEKSQRERFIEAARSIGVDETGQEFEVGLTRMIPARKSKAGSPNNKSS